MIFSTFLVLSDMKWYTIDAPPPSIITRAASSGRCRESQSRGLQRDFFIERPLSTASAEEEATTANDNRKGRVSQQGSHSSAPIPSST